MFRFTPRINRVTDAGSFPPVNRTVTQGLIWYETPNTCALADSERHLAHALKTERGWIAYDGTNSNPEGNGFNELGTFTDIRAAKAAIEEALAICGWRGKRQSGAPLLIM
jgi:hypothetical protein